MHIKISKTKLELLEKEFTALKADALVFPTNDYLWMGSPISSTIKKHAGVQVEKEALPQGPAPLGTAIVTSAGSLPYTYLIHAVCMGQDGRIDEKTVKSCILKSLETAETNSCKTIVIIPFFLEHSGASSYKVAESTLEGCIEHCVRKSMIETITIAISEPSLYTIFQDTLARHFSAKPPKK